MGDRLAISDYKVAVALFRLGWTTGRIQEFIDYHTLSSGYIYADLIPSK